MKIMEIKKETRRLSSGVPKLSELKGTDFFIVARVDDERNGTLVEYTLEFAANFAANAIYAAITIISIEQQVEPCNVIVSHVAQRHATTGEMVKVL